MVLIVRAVSLPCQTCLVLRVFLVHSANLDGLISFDTFGYVLHVSSLPLFILVEKSKDAN